MNHIQFTRRRFSFLLIVALLSFSYGCKKDPLTNGKANLNIISLDIVENYHSQYIDIPNGTFVPSDPNFSLNDPSTWTGNMAQYVVDTYSYTVSYQIKNAGNGTAFDSEIDLGYFFEFGDDGFETRYVGHISAGDLRDDSFEFISYNRKLEQIGGEVYWYYE